MYHKVFHFERKRIKLRQMTTWPQVHTIGFYPLAAGPHDAPGATHRGETFLRALASLTRGTYREHDSGARFQVRRLLVLV